MATKQFDVRVQHKRDSEANWNRLNPVLLDGELIFVTMENGDVCRKIGNGTSAYSDLPLLPNVTEAEKSAWNAKANGDHDHKDYAPAYSELVNLTASTALSDLHYGCFMTVVSDISSTITLPTAPTTYHEMELINLGTGEVTISGLMQNGMTGIVLNQGNAVTLKSSGSYWCAIGAYKEV